MSRRDPAPSGPVSAAESAERMRGILLICIAVATFACLDASAKYAARWIPVWEIVWARYTISLVLAVAYLRPWRHLADYVTHRPVAQIVRAVFLLASTGFNFIAVSHLQLADTVSINFAAPLMVTALSGPMLGEWPGPRRWAAVVVGFIGVLIVLRPTPDAFQPAALWAVGSAICYTGYQLTTRQLTATESPAGLLVYGSLIAVIATSPPIPFIGVAPPTWQVWVALAITGIAGTVGHWLLIIANRDTPAPVLAPFVYTEIVWMIVIGYALFGDLPQSSTLIGAAVVVASGLYVLYRERVHRDR
jgi:drug/metabolite transporter (DMT)-like permease